MSSHLDESESYESAVVRWYNK